MRWTAGLSASGKLNLPARPQVRRQEAVIDKFIGRRRYGSLAAESHDGSIRAAIIDRYRRVARPHPRLEDQAVALADTIIAEFRPEYVEAALRRAARYAAASEHLWQVERAREREVEIARNRRKPPRLKLYDV